MAEDRARELLAFLRSRREEMSGLLKRLAEAESPSLQPERQHEMFALLAAELRESEYVVRRVRGHGTGDHLYAVPRHRTRSAPYQLLIGHMDTVWPVGTIETMPVHQEDGLLFGPGVADMKGGLVEAVFALRALRELGLGPSVTPVVFVNSDEEIGSDDSTRFVRRLARGADRAFVLESGEGPDGKLKIARKGVSRFVVTVRGRPAHAGADPEHGVSAILELSHQIQRLFALNDPSRGVTVNVGTIDGGLRPNVVAPTATAMVDVRTPTAAQLRRVERAIRDLEPVLPGAQLEIAGGDGRPPMEPFPRNRALLASAMSLGQEVDLRIEDAGLVGGGSDANTTSMFTATVDGLGPVAAGSHAVDERLDLTTLPERTALLALLLLEPPTREHRRDFIPRSGATPDPRDGVRVALLGTDSSVTNPELVDAWSSLGIEIALLGPAEATEWVDPGDIVLGRLDVLPSLDGVQPGLISLLMLERRGLRVLNPASALVRAHDKLLTARVFLGAGIPHPRTERLLPGRDLLSVGPPCVIKPRFGSWGADVTRCDTPDELERHVEQLQGKPWFLRRGAVAQELVPPVGFDLRLLVAGGAVVGAINRLAAPGEWRTNVSLGGSREPAVPPREACDLGLAAAKAIGADLVGVDLLPVEGGYTVVELNGAVDFNRDYSLPGEDVYEQSARMLRLVPAAG
jgi:glutamate carboxypeptidase